MQNMQGIRTSFPNKGRRIFRGRGRGGDGNIPPNLSKRNKALKTSTVGDDEVGKVQVQPTALIQTIQLSVDDSKQNFVSFKSRSEKENDQHLLLTERSDEKIEETKEENNLITAAEGVIIETQPSEIIIQMKHVQKRIQNTQESIQTSSNALSSPDMWKTNCLNAVKNCANEWRSIVSFHQNNFQPTELEISKLVSLQLFGLIQLSLQCGPLRGSKAGYFKRCGGNVAILVHEFLLAVTGVDGGCRDMNFTEKQCNVVQKWLRYSEKASYEDKSPTKSALKLQQGKRKTKKSI